MRVYAAYKPFIEDKVDTFAEVTQWQLYFTMLAALAIRVNVDDESLQDRNSFDVVLVILQFIAPVIVVGHYAIFEARDDARTIKALSADANEGRGRLSSGIFDVFSGFRARLGSGKKTLTNGSGDDGEGGLELGDIYSSVDETRNSENPLHVVPIPIAIKRPSAVPLPPLDWDGYEKKEYQETKKQKLKEIRVMKNYLRAVSGERPIEESLPPHVAKSVSKDDSECIRVNNSLNDTNL